MEYTMSRILIGSDLHLGHANILKFREGFSSLEEHNEIIYDNFASAVSKRDTLLLLGDVAFTEYWNSKIAEINCKKVLVMGNHETDRQVSLKSLVVTYDKIHALTTRRNCWLSHCPIHPQEFRGKQLNIHGHLHTYKVLDGQEEDVRYVNVSVDQTNFKPLDFQEVYAYGIERLTAKFKTTG